MFSGDSVMHSYGSGKEIVNVKLPSVSAAEGSQDVNSDHPSGKNLQIQGVSWAPHLDEQIPDLVTLSLLPKSQWQSLVNLDIIKVLQFFCSLCSY